MNRFALPDKGVDFSVPHENVYLIAKSGFYIDTEQVSCSEESA